MKLLNCTGVLIAASFVGAPWLVSGCGGAADAPEQIASYQAPIIGGTTSNGAAANGWVQVNHLGFGSCTGTLIQNDLVITARHCTTTNLQITGNVDSNPANYQLVM